MTINGVTVKYIGRENPFLERNYLSDLLFEPGQSRTVPQELAAKLLRHSDCFETSIDTPAKQDDTDSTQVQLDAAKAAKKQVELEANNRQDLVDRVTYMDKDSLQDWAKINYGQIVPKTLSVENMRSRVVTLIDQYGVL